MEENTAKKESKIKKYLHRYFIDAMSAMAQGLFASLLICFVLPALLSLVFDFVLRKINLVRPGDMKLDI